MIRMHRVFAEHSISYELSFLMEDIYVDATIHTGELVIQ
jgi:hypothetical protein